MKLVSASPTGCCRQKTISSGWPTPTPASRDASDRQRRRFAAGPNGEKSFENCPIAPIRFNFKACQNVTGILCERRPTAAAADKTPIPPARTAASAPKIARLKKLKPRVQIIATQEQREKTNHRPIVHHSRAINERRHKQTPSRSSSRYSSSDQITTANSSRSNISPVQLVARSQNVNCKPQTSTASSGGSHALQVVRNEKSLPSRSRCASVRSCGKIATDRASRPSANAAHTAENKFNASGISAAGSQRKGDVTRKKMGFNTSGCHVQPEIFATVQRLNSDTQRFSVRPVDHQHPRRQQPRQIARHKIFPRVSLLFPSP